jgi:hypothetical protein
MSQILREIVASIITHQPDLELIAEPTYDLAQIAATIDRTRAEVVVLSTHKLELLLFLLFEVHPRPRVLVLAEDGRKAYLCEPLGELSPAGLLDAIRHPSSSR